MTRVVFLDRGGVINRKAPDGKYVTRWRQGTTVPHRVMRMSLGRLFSKQFHGFLRSEIPEKET